MIFVTETWIFDEPIQHFLAKVFVLKVVGISYFFAKQGYDLEVQLVVFEENSVLKSEMKASKGNPIPFDGRLVSLGTPSSPKIKPKIRDTGC